MKTLTMKPLNWLKVSRQARRHFDEEELRQLGESLKVKQLQPIVARPDGTIIAGERRYRAAMLVGLKELMVIISEEPLSETQIRVFQLMENIHRADLRDGEKFRACEELVRLNPHWTNQDLSSHLHLSESTITKYLSPARCIKDVQDALEEGRIGITTCYEISRVPAEKQAELLRLKLSGTSRDGLTEHVRKQKNADQAQVRSKRISCPLPSGVSIIASGDSLSLDDLIRALGEAQSEAKRARDQGLDARTFSAVMKDKSKKIASTKTTLSTTVDAKQ
jgi:ParB family transcriptional regulator, chromosome partitioning protein